MNTEREKKAHLPLTGRRYKSVEDFMTGEGVSADVRTAVSTLKKETAIVNHLIQARREAGLTQAEMADKIDKTQSAVSKLESSYDSEITLSEIASYADGTEQTFCIFVGAEMNHIEAVKWHAFGIKGHLLALAKEAHRNEEAQQAVQAFFGEAFFNLLNILGTCHNELPKTKGVQVRFKTVGGNCPEPQSPSPRIAA
jgi:transcriptional regulator with XRE-family HTH domain